MTKIKGKVTDKKTEQMKRELKGLELLRHGSKPPEHYLVEVVSNQGTYTIDSEEDLGINKGDDVTIQLKKGLGLFDRYVIETKEKKIHGCSFFDDVYIVKQ